MGEELSAYSVPQLETIAEFLTRSGQVLQDVAGRLKTAA
ncbi:hypothetical protein D187_000467 [Cystobacter fuscus DSM 2262]|uniref:Uncharacterized protein n=1 Tax=Cystobacter fuscus (strain ATCC 25194 / DSM 2262 / NBRC 100088 / M29) TaxID=1242864 RepID=S9PRA1_CYSF2|nr:hypothetical protein D187_000467 [Cystobacter fuscus DSM 2262]